MTIYNSRLVTTLQVLLVYLSALSNAQWLIKPRRQGIRQEQITFQFRCLLQHRKIDAEDHAALSSRQYAGLARPPRLHRGLFLLGVAKRNSSSFSSSSFWSVYVRTGPSPVDGVRFASYDRKTLWQIRGMWGFSLNCMLTLLSFW